MAPSAKGTSRHHPIDLTDDGPPSKKRKYSQASSHAAVSAKAPQHKLLSKNAPSSSAESPKKKKRSDPPEEKRLRQFRKQPPQSFADVRARALSQRFYVLQRERSGTDECPEERIEMAGTTGNIYTITIGRLLSCTCPHYLKGNHCKHIIYIMSQVLRAPLDLVYQRALLSLELCQVFEGAPPIVPAKPAKPDVEGGDGRKEIEGDCPICFCALDASQPDSITWCRATCGQNIHQECFDVWARTKTGSVTCPMCRSKWEGSVSTGGNETTSEGYVNIANQLGISGERDYRTYSEWFNRPRNNWGRQSYHGRW